MNGELKSLYKDEIIKFYQDMKNHLDVKLDSKLSTG